MALDDGDREGALRFATALSELKRRGATLLVVGAVPDGMHASASDRLLGDDGPDVGVRRRLLVASSDRVREPFGAWLEDPTVDRAVVYEATERSAAAATARPPIALTTVGDLGELGAAIEREIDALDREADGMAPAELRVRLDSIDALYDAHREDRLFRFLHLFTHAIRRRRGIGHAHLRRDRTTRFVRTFEPLFDVVVELHATRAGPRQRWHLRDTDISSDWFPL